MRPNSQTRGTPEPELPELDAGVRLLNIEGTDRATEPLHSLVLDHLLLNEGTAVWVDAGGHAVTQSLASLAPSTRALDRIRVARAFTAHQHYRLVRRLREQVGEETTLLVCPELDRFYREAETYADEGEDLLLRTLATIAGIADRHDVPVLVTRATADSFSNPIEAAAEETIRCERTKFGPRFVGAEFETLVYPMEGGTVQTTLAFWKRVLKARATASDAVATPTPEVTVDGAY
ncbi:hypothetical protein NGM10_11680 [Halorussus salilacus]|uniref:hypothetical protein n=1 Tax=Halorussus salilacus TaxID=2953750 RepID=UPI00209D06B1|nr:hypothetical protein [Halorussus salilacus]USZ67385.1 hypothetical protein NGM10_11680 [Halorussus salilacus]